MRNLRVGFGWRGLLTLLALVLGLAIPRLTHPAAPIHAAATVSGNDSFAGVQRVYNLEVQTRHTYAVSRVRALVHNHSQAIPETGVIQLKGDGTAGVAVSPEWTHHGDLGREAFGDLEIGARRYGFSRGPDGTDGAGKWLVTGSSTGFVPTAEDVMAIRNALAEAGLHGEVHIAVGEEATRYWVQAPAIP